MKIEIKVDGKSIRVVNIPVENPEFKLDAIALGNDFQDWLENYFGVGV